MPPRPPGPGLQRLCTACGELPQACPFLGPACARAARSSEGSIPVVATWVRRGAHVLLCKRPDHKRHGGLWEFPGGKLLPEETLGEAAARELGEELALRLTALHRHLGVQVDPGAPFELHFIEVSASGEARPLEHSELAWVDVTQADALADFPLAPGDRAFLKRWLAQPGE